MDEGGKTGEETCIGWVNHMTVSATPWTTQSVEFSRPERWRGQPFPSPGDLPNPGIKPRSPALQADSLPAEPPGKPKNTGVGSLALLQRIFLTQESNRGLLHCRRTLYQLSYQGSPQTRVIFPGLSCLLRSFRSLTHMCTRTCTHTRTDMDAQVFSKLL